MNSDLAVVRLPAVKVRQVPPADSSSVAQGYDSLRAMEEFASLSSKDNASGNSGQSTTPPGGTFDTFQRLIDIYGKAKVDEEDEEDGDKPSDPGERLLELTPSLNPPKPQPSRYLPTEEASTPKSSNDQTGIPLAHGAAGTRSYDSLRDFVSPETKAEVARETARSNLTRSRPRGLER